MTFVILDKLPGNDDDDWVQIQRKNSSMLYWCQLGCFWRETSIVAIYRVKEDTEYTRRTATAFKDHQPQRKWSVKGRRSYFASGRQDSSALFSLEGTVKIPGGRKWQRKSASKK